MERAAVTRPFASTPVQPVNGIERIHFLSQDSTEN